MGGARRCGKRGDGKIEERRSSGGIVGSGGDGRESLPGRVDKAGAAGRRNGEAGRRNGEAERKTGCGAESGGRRQVEQQGSDKGRIKKSAGAAGCRCGGKSGGEERVAGQRKVREAMEERGVWGKVAARNGGEQRQGRKNYPAWRAGVL